MIRRENWSILRAYFCFFFLAYWIFIAPLNFYCPCEVYNFKIPWLPCVLSGLLAGLYVHWWVMPKAIPLCRWCYCLYLTVGCLDSRECGETGRGFEPTSGELQSVWFGRVVPLRSRLGPLTTNQIKQACCPVEIELTQGQQVRKRHCLNSRVRDHIVDKL